jgi:hypothetical protein
MENLKTTLTSVIAGEVNHISMHILDEMIENIGTTDPVVRDQLIFSALCKLIFDDRLEKEQLEYILISLLKNRSLFFDIENSTTDSVFTRSFTSLIFAAILEYDVTKQILDEGIVRQVINASHDYMMNEQDLRGYVQDKGWAHAVAHGADLLESLIKHQVSTEADARKVLKHIARFLTIAEGYQDDEEERLARAFVTLATHHLTDEIISDWLYSLDRSLKEKRANANGEFQPYYAQLAFKNFLKSAFFLFEKHLDRKPLQHTIKQVVCKLIH